MTYDHESDNLLARRIDELLAENNRQDLLIGILACALCVAIVLAFIFYIGPLTIPQKGAC